MKISQYYKIKDATKSFTAEAKGINNNNYTEEDLYRITRVASYTLDPIYEAHGRIFAISSWYRCPKLNSAVGGVANSEHTLGSAVDLIPLGIGAFELAHRIKDSKAKYNKLVLEYKNGKEWVHIQYREECEHLCDDYTYFANRCYMGLHFTEPKEAA